MILPPHPPGHVTASRFADVLTAPKLSQLHESQKKGDVWMVIRSEDGAIMGDGFKRKADAEATRKQLDSDARGDSWSATAITYRNELLGALLTGWQMPSASVPATEWGLENEPYAIAEIAARYGADCVRPAYIEHPQHPGIGGCPDLLIGDDVYCELKCPYEPRNTVAYRMLDRVPRDYYHQVMGYGWVTARRRYVFAVYDPRLRHAGLDPLYTYTAEYEPSWERKYAEKIVRFQRELEQMFLSMTEVF